MSNKLRVLYYECNKPKTLPYEEDENAVVVAPGENWVLVCNGSLLRSDLLTCENSQFVSGPVVEGYEEYPTVLLDQECVDLPSLQKMLKGMGFDVTCEEMVPASWH